MKAFTILFVLVMITGCSSMVISKHNIHPNAVSKLEVGQTYEQVVNYFGSPLTEEPINDGVVDVGAMYTSDRVDGDIFYCRDLFILYKKSDKGLVVKDFFFGKNNQNSQQRCNNYAASATQNNNAWAGFFQGASQSLNSMQTQREISSNPQFCYYSDYGTKGLCYLSLSSCRESISLHRGGYCQIEQ